MSLNDLIGRVYDAAIDPALWHDAVDAIRVRYRFQVAMLTILRMPAGSAIVQVACNVPDYYLELTPRLASNIPDLWGGPEAILRLPVEEPLLHSETDGFERKDGNPWYLEWARPQGLEDQVVLVLRNDAKVAATLGLGMHFTRGPVSAEELDELRLLTPHLKRAAHISQLLDEQAAVSATFEAAFEVIPSGGVLVDANLNIVHANSAATAMLESGDPVRRIGDRLEVARPLVASQLEDAVRIAATDEVAIGRRGLGVPAFRRDGSAVALHVLPLARRMRPLTPTPRAAAAVFITEPDPGNDITIDAVTALYDLTPAEAHIFRCVVEGLSSREMALKLGIATSTARTHLLRVFDKTGRHRRIDLVHLAHGLGERRSINGGGQEH